MTEWMDISTAPFGERVLIYQPATRQMRWDGRTRKLKARVTLARIGEYFDRPTLFWQPIPPSPTEETPDAV